MNQQEEKKRKKGRPRDLDAWMDEDDWEQVRLDQLKLMLSDSSDPDFDLDKTLGFDEGLLEGDGWEPDVPGFADRRSRAVREILEEQKGKTAPEPRRVRNIDPMPEDVPVAATEEPKNTEKTPENRGKVPRRRGRKQEKPVEAEAQKAPSVPENPKKAPTLFRDTVSLEEALARISIPMDEDPPDMTLEEAMKGFEIPEPNPRKQRWEAEMPRIDFPEEAAETPEPENQGEAEAEKAPRDTELQTKQAESQEKKARKLAEKQAKQAEAQARKAQAQEKKAQAQAEKQAKKAEKEAAHAAARESRKDSLAGLLILVCLESAAWIGLLVWWYQWMQ